MIDEEPLDAVLAHSLLGTVAAVKGAIDTVLTHHLDESTKQSLMLMAQRRLNHLAEQLRLLALGVPDPIPFGAMPAAVGADGDQRLS